jgi:predicted metalloprotease with PDZ domain
MQAMWTKHGRAGQKEPGKVATPYTTDDLKAVLGEVSGDRAFAIDFFARYVQGHELVDYGRLLTRAGLVLRKRAAGAAFINGAQLTFGAGGARVNTPVPFDSALYKAGVERDDLIVSIDTTAMTSQQALDELLRKHKPGTQVPIRFARRGGETVNATLLLEENPRMEIVPVEQAGGTLSDEQRRFREDWLGSKVK